MISHGGDVSFSQVKRYFWDTETLTPSRTRSRRRRQDLHRLRDKPVGPEMSNQRTERHT
ncbi:hypothetical protein ABIC28_005133 [Rhodococcus sp. PvR044]